MHYDDNLFNAINHFVNGIALDAEKRIVNKWFKSLQQQYPELEHIHQNIPCIKNAGESVIDFQENEMYGMPSPAKAQSSPPYSLNDRYFPLVNENIPESLSNITYQLFTAVSIYLAKEELNLMHEKLRMQLIEINNYKKQLCNESFLLDEEPGTKTNYPGIIGNSPAIRNIFQLIEKVAPVNSTVLILGETGTGKELIAKAIHNNSPRKNKTMIKVNCAALPPSLIESELFGHERGSFTGATERRIGKFEQADGGSIFLDEVGEMPLDLQVKLLRALQEREIERIGGKNTIKIDVRIIAATNRDLEKEMAEGRFRRDLYYRLNIFPITLPSLKERKQDIPLLASHFIKRFTKQTGKAINRISNSAIEEMMLYNWPGNIRELEHLIERSILLARDNIINNIPLPLHKQNPPCELRLTNKELIVTMDDNERNHINMVLKHCKGKVGGYQGAAKLLGIPASTLFSKMKKLGIKRDFI